MQDDVIDSVGSKIVSSEIFSDETTLVWHAGEPLVLPAEWYKRTTTRIEAAAGRSIPRQSFQTNATLINDAWLDYFAMPHVSVGVSLDGPEDINDLYRRDRGGRGVWRTSMRGIERLHARSIPFHIIAVVTEAALNRPEEIARALIAAGPTAIGLNLEEIDGTNTYSSLLSKASQTRVRRFLDRFLDVLESTRNAPMLREQENVHRLLRALRSGHETRNQENAAGAILSVDVKGNLSTYSPELIGVPASAFGDFVFGNLNDIRDLTDIFLNRDFLRAYRAISSGVANCRRHCGHFALCGGGAPSNKFGETGRLDVGETAFCRLAVKTVLDHLATRGKEASPTKEVAI